MSYCIKHAIMWVRLGQVKTHIWPRFSDIYLGYYDPVRSTYIDNQEETQINLRYIQILELILLEYLKLTNYC